MFTHSRPVIAIVTRPTIGKSFSSPDSRRFFVAGLPRDYDCDYYEYDSRRVEPNARKMTVLTFPSTVKSDKVPLVDDADRDDAAGARPSPPPPSYDDPKLLESGGDAGGARIAGGGHCRYGRLACHVAKAVLVLLAVALAMLIAGGVLCKAYGRDAQRQQQQMDAQQRQLDAAAAAMEDADADDAVKSYASYAAAENDMLSMVPSSADADYDPVGRFNPAQDDEYRRLLKSALDRHRDMMSPFGDVFSPSSDVFKIEDGKAAPVAVTQSARFIHDFSANVTGIVDVEGKRCFVMPLVRDSVAPPTSLYDLLLKMSSGYYTVDIKRIMDNMRVVKPAVEDLSDYGMYISKDCANYPTFKLEKVVPAVDSAAPTDAVAVSVTTDA